MKKILEVFGEPIASGGQEAFVNNLLTNMDMTGLSVDLYTPYYCENERYRQNILNMGGQVFAAGLPFTPGKSRKNIIAPFQHHLKNNNYDIVHIHSGSVSVLAYIARTAKQCGVKRIIVHSHCASERETLKHILIMKLTKKMMETSPTDYFACSVEAAKWKFPKNIADKKTVIIKNGIELDRYAFDAETREHMRNHLSIGKDTFLIGHVGRFSYQKNHKFILAVFAAFLKKCGNARLILVGNGEMMPEIKDIAAREGLTDNIYFLGNISNVNEVLQAMDVFVFPSNYEGFGMAALEAQAAGLPVLVSDKIPGDLKLTDSIRYLPVDNVQPWVDALINLENRPRYDNTLILREKGFDIQATVNIIHRIYCQ